MPKPKISVISLFFSLLCFLVVPLTDAIEKLPDNSVYQLPSQWHDQNNNPLSLADLAGKIQVVAFMYTYCEHSCPVILSTLKRIDKQLTMEQRQHLNFLIISLDPDRDTPEILNAYMNKNNLEQTRWRLLHGNADDVLELAALFGVRYKPMDVNDDIAHSNMITVLDRQGAIDYQMQGLNKDLSKTLAGINALTIKNTGSE